MGVFCEINLTKPVNGAFVPGTTVAGTIKYAFDEETTINKIIVSLKGSGHLRIKDSHQKKKKNPIYRNRETYVDKDFIVQQDEKGALFSKGLYETKFSFILPDNIPPTFNYLKLIPRYNIRCVIAYYVRIKFEKPGIFTFNKHFRKDITVVSGIKPRLPTLPTVYGEQKNLFHLFSRQSSVVNIKANVESCVITPGGKIELNYEVANNSLVVVKGVETKLIETYTFKPLGHVAVRAHSDVLYTGTKTPAVEMGDTQKMLVVMNVPTEKTSIEHSNIVSRDYFIKMTVILPMPHFNATLEIPVQIGDEINANNPAGAVGVGQLSGADEGHSLSGAAGGQLLPTAPPYEERYDDPPPSYWEVMGEQNEDKEKDFDSD